MPILVGIGISTQKNALVAAEEAATQAKANSASGKYDLAFIFATSGMLHPHVLEALSESLKGVTLLGSSSLAILSPQGIIPHGIGILLLRLPKGIYFNASAIEEITSKGANGAGKALGEKLTYGFRDLQRVVGILFSDGLIANTSDFIEGIQGKTGKSFPLVGASSSDKFLFKNTAIFFEERLIPDAACGIIFGGHCCFGLGIHHGWKPLGKSHQVTKSSGDRVYTIDERPAADIYTQYLDCNQETLLRDRTLISICYPLGVYLEEEKEYLLRNILAIEKDGSLHMQGNLPEKSTIRLMIGTKDSCLDATRAAVAEAQQGLMRQKTKFALVFNSTSRYMLLRNRIDEEITLIKEGLGKNTPFLGIYTYGEQAPLKALSYQGRTHVHNQSIAVLAIGEGAR
ncbi:MAG: FIST C-terminal domain-containing protein [Candidatus Omnitrophica bacterium]|nr:FIST C-terminal domain-containing protein [Candidatus Omnitrophota bacterium]